MEGKKQDEDPDSIHTDYATLYWKHVVNDVESSCNEVYGMCFRTNNASVCKEMVITFQHLAYDFKHLLDCLVSKEQGINSGEPNRTNIFSPNKEEMKVRMPAKKSVKDCFTQTDFDPSVGVNVFAQPFLPNYPNENDEEPFLYYDDPEEFPEDGAYPPDMSPDLSPNFMDPQYLSCQPRSLWHIPTPHHQPFPQYPQFQQIGSNFITGAPIPFAPLNSVVPTHFSAPAIYSNNLQPYPPPTYHFNGNFQNQNMLPAYQAPNSCYEIQQNVRPYNKAKYKGKSKSPKSLSNSDPKSFNLDGNDNAIIVDNINPNINPQVALTETLNSSDDRMPPANSINAEPEIKSLVNSRLLSSDTQLETTDHEKQFPELKAEKGIFKKHRNKFPKVKYQKKVRYSFDDFNSSISSNYENKENLTCLEEPQVMVVGTSFHQVPQPLASPHLPPTQLPQPLPLTQLPPPLPPTQLPPPLTPTQLSKPLPPTQLPPPLTPTQLSKPLPPTQLPPPLTPTQLSKPLPPTQLPKPSTQQPQLHREFRPKPRTYSLVVERSKPNDSSYSLAYADSTPRSVKQIKISDSNNSSSNNEVLPQRKSDPSNFSPNSVVVGNQHDAANREPTSSVLDRNKPVQSNNSSVAREILPSRKPVDSSAIREIVPPQVVERKKPTDSNSTARESAHIVPPRFRKGMHPKGEAYKKNTYENSRFKKQQSPRFNDNKTPTANPSRENHVGSKKKMYEEILEDGWQTVRYKNRDSGSSSFDNSPQSNKVVDSPELTNSTKDVVILLRERNATVPASKDRMPSSNSEEKQVRIDAVNNTSQKTETDEDKPSKNADKTFGMPVSSEASKQFIEAKALPIQEAESEKNDESLLNCDETNHEFSPFFDIGICGDFSSSNDASETGPKMSNEEKLQDHLERGAQDMYSEFFQYIAGLNWATQMDEIESFARLLNKGVPLSFVKSYSSPEIEHFKKFMVDNPEGASKFRSEIILKHKRWRETEEKKNKANANREQILQCKAAKVKEFVKKVEEVRAAKYKLALEMKSQIDKKLKKAEENRKLHLSIIKRKAHDEEEKLKEIAFINELEAQNRRHDSLVLRQEHEDRIQGIIEERQRKVEEKAAKDAAVEERRRVLEAERQAKLQKMSEKRRKKEETIDRKQQEKEKERQEIAREKARDREERLLARQAAQLANAEELQKRIKLKQEESARRHEENIELIRQKALDIGLHKTTEDAPTEEQNGESHHYSYNELLPSYKKRCKKIRFRMMTRGTNYIRDLDYTGPIHKCKIFCELNDLEKLLITNLDDKSFGLISQKFLSLHEHIKQQMPKRTNTFKNYQGFILCRQFLKTVVESDDPQIFSGPCLKSLTSLVTLLETVALQNHEHTEYLLLSSDIALVFDLLQLSFNMLKLKRKREDWIILAGNLFNIILRVFIDVKQCEESQLTNYAEFISRIPDVVSYFISCGVVHNIIDLLRSVIIDGSEHLSPLVGASLYTFTILLDEKFYSTDVRTLMSATDCLETTYFLCESLQKMTASNGKYLPGCAFPIINMLLKFAMIDINSFQAILGADGMALQLRSIASIVITFCQKNPHPESLLFAMIQVIGYFAIKNEKNMAFIQSGQQPTVLQLLVSLPFQYFCNESYMKHLFPTLLACAHENPVNKAIIECDFRYETLETFAAAQEPGAIKLLDIFYGRIKDNKTKRKKNKKSKKSSSPEPMSPDDVQKGDSRRDILCISINGDDTKSSKMNGDEADEENDSSEIISIVNRNGTVVNENSQTEMNKETESNQKNRDKGYEIVDLNVARNEINRDATGKEIKHANNVVIKTNDFQNNKIDKADAESDKINCDDASKEVIGSMMDRTVNTNEIENFVMDTDATRNEVVDVQSAETDREVDTHDAHRNEMNGDVDSSNEMERGDAQCSEVKEVASINKTNGVDLETGQPDV